MVVPDAGSFDAFAASLDAAKLARIGSGLTAQHVLLSMPRFKVETTSSLKQVLSDLGMPSAFSGGANLSGMDGTSGLFIEDVLHRAFIDVAEKGTEAAAATAVIIGRKAADPDGLRINVDRPFLYFLHDQPTGAILFMGRVLNPA